MQQKIHEPVSQAMQLRHANRRMLTRYAHWADYMLTVTFKASSAGAMPSDEQVRAQLRHMQCTLNKQVWKNRTRYNAKCQILFVPVIEGANTSTRIHAHVLLGNVKNRAMVLDYMHAYISRSNWLAPRFDLREVHDADGVAWYLAKETAGVNADAVAWEIAAIPKPLLPK